MKTFAKITTFAALSGLAFGSAATAGNLADPVVETPIAQPVYEATPIVGDWTGFYGGLNLGYADVDGPGDADGDNGTYGVHIGYDYDFGNFVLGGELEYDKIDVDLNGAATADDVARIKLRGGYDLGKTLIYATAGSARVDTTLGDDTGAFVGIGAVYKVTDTFTIGGELLEHQFDDINGTGVDADATTFNLRGSFRF
ncbi:porin [uncultured Sulfitobacter sp.]|uniref:outer membrane protein n=1 Tax=uncultured Sulfitobacter sp. TaxID=191468 RepID=UPI00262B4534|nr:porin [uncultured Sulfitobacter sp.]